jgi:hypothetical protein
VAVTEQTHKLAAGKFVACWPRTKKRGDTHAA